MPKPGPRGRSSSQLWAQLVAVVGACRDPPTSRIRLRSNGIVANDRRRRLGYYAPLVIAVAMLAGLALLLLTLVHAGALLLYDWNVH